MDGSSEDEQGQEDSMHLEQVRINAIKDKSILNGLKNLQLQNQDGCLDSMEHKD
jgi:hypothetical protein